MHDDKKKGDSLIMNMNSPSVRPIVVRKQSSFWKTLSSENSNFALWVMMFIVSVIVTSLIWSLKDAIEKSETKFDATMLNLLTKLFVIVTLVVLMVYDLIKNKTESSIYDHYLLWISSFAGFL